MRQQAIRFVVVAAVATPLLLLTLPWLLVRGLGIRRRRAEAGLVSLPPFLARTVEAYAEAMVRAIPPGEDWSQVARNLDRFVASTRSPRIWRVRALLLLMEVAPLLVFERPFSLLGAAERRRFVDRHLVQPQGLFRLVAAGGQLVRLGYYTVPGTLPWSAPVEA